MGRQNVEGYDTLNVAREKINENFIELYAGAALGTAGSAELDELSDVDTSGAVNGNVLVYDTSVAGGTWVAKGVDIDNLSGVDQTGATNGWILVYDTTGTGTWKASELNLNLLTDVVINTPATPTDTQVLTYDDATGKWVNRRVRITEAFDVAVTTPIKNKDLLVYNTSNMKFENTQEYLEAIKNTQILALMGVY